MQRIVYLLLFVLHVVQAQSTTTPAPYVPSPCIYATWNDTLTFSGIIAGTIIASALLGVAIGFGVEEARNNGWNFKMPWAKNKMDQDYMYRPVILAPINR